MNERVTKVLISNTSGDAVRVDIDENDGGSIKQQTLAPGEAKYFGLREGARMLLQSTRLNEEYRVTLGLRD